MSLQLLIRTQSIVFFAASILFPFYLFFLKEIGQSYSQFGIAYGLFGLAAAISQLWIGRLGDTLGAKTLLMIHSGGMALLLLALPFVTATIALFIFQILLGVLGAFQKTGEKLAVASFQQLPAGQTIGQYHFKTGVFASFGAIAAGYFVDFFTLGFLFAFCSVFYAISFVLLARLHAK